MANETNQTVFSENGETITRYLVRYGNTFAMVIDYGATLTHYVVETARGPVDVVLGFDDPFQYKLPFNPYFGCVVGRACNRTAHGSFTLDGLVYNLPINNGPNSLHGGIVGFDKKMWNVLDATHDTVKMHCESAHLEEGFPGAISVIATYTINKDGLSVAFEALLKQDSPVPRTYISLTLHPYFNLSGNSDKTIQRHIMHAPYSDFTLELDEFQIPTGKQLTPETDPAFFFREPSEIGPRLDLANLQQFRGFDHYYHVESEAKKPWLTVEHPTSKIALQVSSDAFGYQFYTGNWLDDSIPSKKSHGAHYNRFAGFCIEPSPPPNAINMKEYTKQVTLSKGDTWKQKITYNISELPA